MRSLTTSISLYLSTSPSEQNINELSLTAAICTRLHHHGHSRADCFDGWWHHGAEVLSRCIVYLVYFPVWAFSGYSGCLPQTHISANMRFCQWIHSGNRWMNGWWFTPNPICQERLIFVNRDIVNYKTGRYIGKYSTYCSLAGCLDGRAAGWARMSLFRKMMTCSCH